jgi:3-(3-hydroxy-phenyl)propionate hydroxylase
MRSFRHGRALFVGDAAHLVSPFGARGANSGIQDVDNLIWKLELVMAGKAPQSLLDSYNTERTFAADENIRHSTRSTDFITPKSAASKAFRDAALLLAKHHAFARRLVNSGRLSLPTILDASPLSSEDTSGDVFASGVQLGGPAVDAPVEGPRGPWLLSYLEGGFTLLVFDVMASAESIEVLANDANSCHVVQLGGKPVRGASRIEDRERLVAARYDGKPGTCYLFRPDQHLCARWRSFDLPSVLAALARATGQGYVEARAAA